MQINFKSEYRSIKELSTTRLPDFCLITGVNGVGKSHFLQAIQNGHISIDNTRADNIRSFDWNTIAKLIESDNASNAPLHRRCRNALDSFFQAIQGIKSMILNNIPYANNLPDGNRVVELIVTGDVNNLIEILKRHFAETQNGQVPASIGPMASSAIQDRISYEKQVYNLAGNYGELARYFIKYCESCEISPLLVKQEDLEKSLPYIWYPEATLEFRFSEWFNNYYLAWERNRIQKFYYTEDNRHDLNYLSDEEFAAQNGDRPWDMLNEVLEEQGVKLRFNPPDFDILESHQYKVTLTDLQQPKTRIQISELSSGEKVIFAVLSLLNQSKAESKLVKLPEVMLLDEIDAPLHPSFTRMLVNIISNVFVKKMGIKVIMTTHSPSTVALVPDESLYELSKEPRMLRQIPKNKAITLLTSGFITVLPGDVIVLVEDNNDAKVYTAYYNVLLQNEHVRNEPPLSFVPASKHKDRNGGGGCNAVNSWLDKINSIVKTTHLRGIIDRDRHNEESQGLKVLKRYSIESYVFDPLTIAALLFKDGPYDIITTKPIKNSNVCSLFDYSPSEMEGWVNDISFFLKKIMGEINNSLGKNGEHLSDAHFSDLVTVHYMGEVSLKIPALWVDYRGHTLVKAIKIAFNNRSNNKGFLPIVPNDNEFGRALDMQTRILPGLISKDFTDIFHGLMN